MLVSERGGDIPAQNPDGLGLYLGDTRYLCAYELRLNKRRPVLLSTTMEGLRHDHPDGQPHPARGASRNPAADDLNSPHALPAGWPA